MGNALENRQRPMGDLWVWWQMAAGAFTMKLAPNVKVRPQRCLLGTCNVVVAGLGNVLLMDDGIGVRAAELLSQDPPPQTLVLPVGTKTFEALPWFRTAPRIVAIDAWEGDDPPGSIYQWTVKDIHHPGSTISLHELAFLSVLEFLPKRARPAIVILGVQPATIAYGPSLTSSLEKVLPQVALAARYLATHWNVIPTCGS